MICHESDFEKLRLRHGFYIDKSLFIKEWLKRANAVDVITRPHGFGKSLNLSMLKCFLSTEYAGRSDLFEGLKIWEDVNIKKQQGTYPVIHFSLASVTQTTMEECENEFQSVICNVYKHYIPLVSKSDTLNEYDKKYFFNRLNHIEHDHSLLSAEYGIEYLSRTLCKHYNKKVIILLDDYDVPMLNAICNGFKDKMAHLSELFLLITFKSNPYIYRGILTGITNIPTDSALSNFDNYFLDSVTCKTYQEHFGFNEQEVSAAMNMFGRLDKEIVHWYGGHTIGEHSGFYTPKSVIRYLETGEFKTCPADFIMTELIGNKLKKNTYSLDDFLIMFFYNEKIYKRIDDFIDFDLYDRSGELLELLWINGYITFKYIPEHKYNDPYELHITNRESYEALKVIVKSWFDFSMMNPNLLYGLSEEEINRMNKAIHAFQVLTTLNLQPTN